MNRVKNIHDANLSQETIIESKNVHRIGIVLQARMGSTRLPGKVMKALAGKPMLKRIIERLKLSREADKIVVATTKKTRDKIIVDLCKREGIDFYTGSEDDVLLRYLGAALAYQINTMVRVTADCPLIDPLIIDRLIKKHLKEKNDFTTNTIQRTFPRGLDAEVVNLEVLRRIKQLTKEKRFHEHVTLYLYEYPAGFKIANLEAEGEYFHPEYRLTVDTKEDFRLISRIYDRLYKNKPIVLHQVFNYLELNPNLLKINQDVKQKEV